MELTLVLIEQLTADRKKTKTYQDLMRTGRSFFSIIRTSIKGILVTELTEHPGYEKYSPI
ncbi:MAG: hypothetical protein ROY99_00635 [Ignavibacterium sp.]|nr:hypothetical protein [Ignavibacterium sp.]